MKIWRKPRRPFCSRCGWYWGVYDCAWQILGTGQFKQGADPHIGKLASWKSGRMAGRNLVPDEKAVEVAKALKESHPYEEPAFEFIQL